MTLKKEEKKSLSVFFLRVTDPQSKIKRVIHTIHHHFFSGDRCIIFVPNNKAAIYIDSLIWKDPKESFIPHVIAESAVEESIVITETKENLNKARVALNLCPEPCSQQYSFDKIYEFWDESDSQKEKLSQEKMQIYAAIEAATLSKI